MCAVLALAITVDAAAQAARDNAKPAAGGSSKTVSPSQQKQLQNEQRQLQRRLADLKRELADAEASHSEAADALAESEAEISAVNRKLREFAAARRQVERQIATLQERSRLAGQRQSDEERQLAAIVRLQYILAREGAWQRLLQGTDPHARVRELHYFDYLARARARSIDALQDRRQELAQLETESRAHQLELKEIADDEARSRAQLLRQQAARKQALAKLSRQITSQRQSIATLERNEQRLAQLIEQLNKMLEEQARERARRATARRKPSAPDASPATPESVPAESQFARLRGKLQLPVKGEIAARFGSARKTEAGVNAPTWKGVFIRADEGADVHAVASGRVVFADWLRGFGNLLIVDHGEGFLSVYGNNESLLKAAGDRVAAEEVVAQVGNTGGNADSGLYFELRYQGRPIDPLSWASAR
ncbi:MAG TPA: peptidoglycan DD-metalloendopeptidase family protein [Burkholderiaceae bacterium]|nr:peptidoglycan DD-metalloendopeptidase family protein [Burkholderiaceae bacterium]